MTSVGRLIPYVILAILGLGLPVTASASPEICDFIVSLHARMDGTPKRVAHSDPLLELKAAEEFLELLDTKGRYRRKGRLIAELIVVYWEPFGEAA